MNYLDDAGVRVMLPQAKVGSITAIEAIYMGNIRLVNKIITEALGNHVNTEEYHSLAFEAVLTAIDKFDPSVDCKFMTYARWWIKQKCMRDAMSDRTVRIPTGQLRLMHNIKKAISSLKSEGVEISDSLIAERAEVSIRQVKGIAYTLTTGTHDETVLDHLYCHHDEPASKRISRLEIFDIVHEIVDKQSPRDKEIVCRRFGLRGFPKDTLDVIGKDMGITRERVRQISWAVGKQIKVVLNNANVTSDEWITD